MQLGTARRIQTAGYRQVRPKPLAGFVIGLVYRSILFSLVMCAESVSIPEKYEVDPNGKEVDSGSGQAPEAEGDAGAGEATKSDFVERHRR